MKKTDRDKVILENIATKLEVKPRGENYDLNGNLIELDLSLLALTELPSDLWELNELKILLLSGNKLTSIPSDIAKLSKLEELSLAGNSLKHIPSEIGELEQLRKLNLGYWDYVLERDKKYDAAPDLMDKVPNENRISVLPAKIFKLKNLEELGLTYLFLEEFSLQIDSFPNLKTLFLGFNRLKELPPYLGRITSLEQLYLHANLFVEIPKEVGQLINLKVLTLGDNPIKKLPVEFGHLTKLERLNTSRCKNLLTPPPEIIGQGIPSTLSFLRELEKDSSIRYEAKLLVVGEGGTGKSTLLSALRGDTDEELSTTHGIEVGKYKVPNPHQPEIDMTLNTWDFGGQEIYHATHQFFLTRRSLYLIVWNARLGADQGRLQYWLDTIKALAPDAPVLLVATHIDERDPDLNYLLYQEAFPQLAGNISVSNLTGQGLNELKRAMAAIAAELPLMGQPWPSTWMAVERDLLEISEHHIDATQYMSCCTTHNVQAEMAQGTLGGYLHDLGKILYFRDDYVLSNLIVLKPNWVTKAISQVLTDERTREAKGILTHADLPRIWSTDDSGNVYEPHLYPVFLRLMERFDLSYQIEADTPGEHATRSLVPQLLPHQPPVELPPWPQNPPAGQAQLEMIYRLDFIPAGIMSWFIVRTHPYTRGLHWREGVLLEYEGHSARVELNPMLREIRLMVWGAQPHNFFTILKNTMDLILARFEGLRISREVPCICHREQDLSQPCPRFYLYEDLVRRMAKRRHRVECPTSFFRVSVPTLLYGIHASTDEEVMYDIKRGQLEISQQLGGLQKLDVIIDKLNQQSELIARNFTRQWNYEMQRLESECPSTFWLATHGRSSFNPKDWVGQEYKMYLICQHPPCPHSVGDGYKLREPEEWWKAVIPWLNHLIKFLKYGVPMGKALGAVHDESAVKERETQIDLMEEVAKVLPELSKSDSIGTLSEEPNLARDHVAVGSALRALYEFLDQSDPSHIWSGLSRAITPDGNILWLCDEHRKQYEAKPLVLNA